MSQSYLVQDFNGEVYQSRPQNPDLYAGIRLSVECKFWLTVSAVEY